MNEIEVSRLERLLLGPEPERAALLDCRSDAPHHYLGPHSASFESTDGHVVRAFHPEALHCHLIDDEGHREPLTNLGDGLFATWTSDLDSADPRYTLAFEFEDGSSWERHDPYRFPPSISDFDLHLFGEGRHFQLWSCLGCRPTSLQGIPGFAFAVWAPNAKRVSLVGDFCHWDGRLFQMRRLGASGVFEIFVPRLASGEIYKYEIAGAHGSLELKADPLARWSEAPPATASRTFRDQYEWQDRQWIEQRQREDIGRRPLAIYEVHVGSWLAGLSSLPTAAIETDGRNSASDDTTGEWSGSGFGRLARSLIGHVRHLGFNSIELMPIAEHPFDGSWGYQLTGYFAPSGRFGNPDDLRRFVDQCHRHDISVILDWVPAHFVKDAHGLGRFDGTALYEHADPRQGEHPDWGTYIFNYSRNEVRNFLIANALYWFEEFHIDALRVDAVASMLYLDYSREDGEWVPNHLGGNQNLAAIHFLRELNQTVSERCPSSFLIAEESTAWSGVTREVAADGLGFSFKWNMGWMHDTLGYFSTDPLFRGGVHHQLTFAMVYEHSEKFLNPLSHDEVVHGKGSLYSKMPGSPEQKMANLRCLIAYQFTRPGKKLLFMGSEVAPETEWNLHTGIDWSVLDQPQRQGMLEFTRELLTLYRHHSTFWAFDPDPESFEWISSDDAERSIVVFARRHPSQPVSALTKIVILNLTPVLRSDFRLRLPAGDYRLLLNSDEVRFGGSGHRVSPHRGKAVDGRSQAESFTVEITLDLPPLSALVLESKDTESTVSGSKKQLRELSRNSD